MHEGLKSYSARLDSTTRLDSLQCKGRTRPLRATGWRLNLIESQRKSPKTTDSKKYKFQISKHQFNFCLGKAFNKKLNDE